MLLAPRSQGRASRWLARLLHSQGFKRIKDRRPNHCMCVSSPLTKQPLEADAGAAQLQTGVCIENVHRELSVSRIPGKGHVPVCLEFDGIKNKGAMGSKLLQGVHLF